ncbi:integrase domain-containing protein [Deferribacteraceae bacterium V6Fe1]|nr:integrase domain-containing protein [Deferribacteraceae bacterium V6Fe1]
MRRNFIGEKDLTRKSASFNLAMAVVKSGNEGSIKKTAHAIKELAEFAKNEFGIKNIVNLDSAHISAFAEYLRDRVNNNEISTGHTSNIISSLNTIFNHFGRDDLRLSANHEGLSRGKRYDNTDKSISNETHNNLVNFLSEKYVQTGDTRFEALRLQVVLQREIGLRFKESALFNGDGVNKSKLIANIEKGTKGGQIRNVTLTEKALNILDEVKDFRKEYRYSHSLVPDSMSFKDWQNFAYNTIKSFNSHSGENYHFHGERHHFAQERYKELTNLEPPARVGLSKEEYLEYATSELNMTSDEVKSLIVEARLTISEELGHHRLEITNYYLGR